MSTLSSFGPIIIPLAAALGGTLYRLRGGWLKHEWLGGSTHLARLLWWVIPTSLLLFFGTTPDAAWYRILLIGLFVWASIALYGHGAHMIFSFNYWLTTKRQTTELLTEFWLPRVFGGVPDETWNETKFVAYNLVGMSFIGLVRNLTMMLPFVILAPFLALWFTLLGATHGFLYWLGEVLPKPEGIHGVSVAEVLVGATTWGFLAWWFVS